MVIEALGRTEYIKVDHEVAPKIDGGIPAMAAMKPRTGDGPLEVTKEGRGIVMRVPLEGGGRLVGELNAAEATALKEALAGVVG